MDLDFFNYLFVCLKLSIVAVRCGRFEVERERFGWVWNDRSREMTSFVVLRHLSDISLRISLTIFFVCLKLSIVVAVRCGRFEVERGIWLGLERSISRDDVVRCPRKTSLFVSL
jgi:hypothetical protein